MKPESKFWKELKQKTPNIQWTRLESWASHGLPDLLGYNNLCGFFMVELKVVTKGKPRFSPHQILFHNTRTVRNFILLKTLAPPSVKLYESSTLRATGDMELDACCLKLDACSLKLPTWSDLEQILIQGPRDAWRLQLVACTLTLHTERDPGASNRRALVLVHHNRDA